MENVKAVVVTARVSVRCPDCNGARHNGRIDAYRLLCRRCMGSGSDTRNYMMMFTRPPGVLGGR